MLHCSGGGERARAPRPSPSGARLRTPSRGSGGARTRRRRRCAGGERPERAAPRRGADVVEQIWVYGSSYESFLVAVVVPNKRELLAWAKEQGGLPSSLEELCSTPEVRRAAAPGAACTSDKALQGTATACRVMPSLRGPRAAHTKSVKGAGRGARLRRQEQRGPPPRAPAASLLAARAARGPAGMAEVHCAERPSSAGAVVRRERAAGSTRCCCCWPQAAQYVVEELGKVSKKERLKGFERIPAVILTPEQFSTDNDLMTPSFKLKRPQLKKHFQQRLDAAYEQEKQRLAAKAK